MTDILITIWVYGKSKTYRYSEKYMQLAIQLMDMGIAERIEVSRLK